MKRLFLLCGSIWFAMASVMGMAFAENNTKGAKALTHRPGKFQKDDTDSERVSPKSNPERARVNGDWLVTCYSDGSACNGKWGPYAAYGGKRLKWGMVAADWRVLKPGTKIRIQGYDDMIFTVMDKGRAIKGNHIDLYVPQASKRQMYNFGRKWLKITVIDRPGSDASLARDGMEGKGSNRS